MTNSIAKHWLKIRKDLQGGKKKKKKKEKKPYKI